MMPSNPDTHTEFHNRMNQYSSEMSRIEDQYLKLTREVEQDCYQASHTILQVERQMKQDTDRMQQRRGALNQIDAQYSEAISQLDQELAAMRQATFQCTLGTSPTHRTEYDTVAKWHEAQDRMMQMQQDYSDLSTAYVGKHKILTAEWEEKKEAIYAQFDAANRCPDAIFQPAASQANTPTHSRPITYITVKCDAGYGNFLSICGNGPAMSWDPEKSVRLRCVGSDAWIYETHHNFESFNFKIVLNNKKWEDGSDHFVHRNNPTQLTPRFSR